MVNFLTADCFLPVQFCRKKCVTTKKAAAKDSLQSFLSFLPFASFAVDKTSLLFQLSQARALSFHRPFPSKCLLAFIQVSIHHGLILKNFKESSDENSGETRQLSGLHMLAGKRTSGERDFWEYTMTLYSVGSYKYSGTKLIWSVLQLTTRRWFKITFVLSFLIFFRSHCGLQ